MGKGRILIIDDDANLRKTLADILRVKGYETRAAKEGAEGLGLLSQNRVDIALIDLNLPGMTGLAVLGSIKAGHPRTEAIILTGNATLDSAVEATNKGAFSYLTKPYEIEQLLIQIKRALEKQRAEQALKESENKFRDLSEKSLAGIYLIQGETFAYVNPMLAEIFGYTVDEIVDKKSPADLTSPEDRQLVRENLRRRLADETGSIHYDFRGIRKNGEVVFVEAYGSKTVYQGKTAIIGTLLDITERKGHEREREQLIDRLREALTRVKTLSGLLPICASCKKIRNDDGYWSQIEVYISDHSEAEFSHGLCPECAKKGYEDLEKLKRTKS